MASAAVMLGSSSATVRKAEMAVTVVVASNDIEKPSSYLLMLCSIGTVETPLISDLVAVVPVVVVSGAVVSGVVVSVAFAIAHGCGDDVDDGSFGIVMPHHDPD